MTAVMINKGGASSQDKLQLKIDIARKTESPVTFAIAIRLLFQNWRQGTVSTKTRGQLAFSNKKPWRQKGTGRARVSSIRSPLWRKGGVIFGPQPRVRTLSLNANQKPLVFNNLFFNKVDANGLFCLDLAPFAKPSTKQAFTALKDSGLENKKILVFLSVHDDVMYSSFRNIPNVSIILFDEPNAYALSNSDCWVFLSKDIEAFTKMVEQWN